METNEREREKKTFAFFQAIFRYLMLVENLLCYFLCLFLSLAS